MDPVQTPGRLRSQPIKVHTPACHDCHDDTTSLPVPLHSVAAQAWRHPTNLYGNGPGQTGRLVGSLRYDPPLEILAPGRQPGQATGRRRSTRVRPSSPSQARCMLQLARARERDEHGRAPPQPRTILLGLPPRTPTRVPPAYRLGGSRATPPTGDRHAAQLAIQRVSDPGADVVRPRVGSASMAACAQVGQFCTLAG